MRKSRKIGWCQMNRDNGIESAGLQIYPGIEVIMFSEG
jgi:hypothetical protein